MDAYYVTIARRGVSPLKLKLLVRATSKDEAAGLATALAELERGGIFSASKARPARGPLLREPLSFDEAA